MGNNYSDLNTMMSMSVEKPMYIAGQMVDGNTRMVIRTHLPYDHLVLKLECYEYCQWKRHANTRIIDNSLKYPDYEGHNRLFYQVYNLAEFPGGVKKGFYVFPFSVRIPSDLPGMPATTQAASSPASRASRTCCPHTWRTPATSICSGPAAAAWST